ncbi:hypothetical protein E4U54_003874 [Claviceps lovelessii]|nr:hypothetical protein E4U54_003874 [Claviceps lovelessii]
MTQKKGIQQTEASPPASNNHRLITLRIGIHCLHTIVKSLPHRSTMKFTQVFVAGAFVASALGQNVTSSRAPTTSPSVVIPTTSLRSSTPSPVSSRTPSVSRNATRSVTPTVAPTAVVPRPTGIAPGNATRPITGPTRPVQPVTGGAFKAELSTAILVIAGLAALA